MKKGKHYLAIGHETYSRAGDVLLISSQKAVFEWKGGRRTRPDAEQQQSRQHYGGQRDDCADHGAPTDRLVAPPAAEVRRSEPGIRGGRHPHEVPRLAGRTAGHELPPAPIPAPQACAVKQRPEEAVLQDAVPLCGSHGLGDGMWLSIEVSVDTGSSDWCVTCWRSLSCHSFSTFCAFVLDLASVISEEFWPSTCAAFVVSSPFLTLRAFLDHTQRSRYLPY